ncbi:hypothetical protein [Kutzneria kofuensis]|uniref:Uncharacterized protein n=1 Tax=Kutzneria kofuensis TaxID=103725 RepID=A0A7W9KE18_9PSEU|nr:hypothetical protein [Kutzneria kofuensis]MBB5890757.1 hypothetical protein [Kutzneria kofuensis]
MSADFYVGFGPHPEPWSCTRGMLGWVLNTVAGHVQDPGLAATLRARADSGLQWFYFDSVERDQVPELVQVMIDVLIPAAEREYGDHPWFVPHTQELVDLVTEWQAEYRVELMEWGYEEALAMSRRQLAAGASMEEVLTRLRTKGFFEAECVLAVQSLTNSTLVEAREVVVHSQAWADRREHTEQLQAALEESLDMWAAESGSVEPESGRGER